DLEIKHKELQQQYRSVQRENEECQEQNKKLLHGKDRYRDENVKLKNDLSHFKSHYEHIVQMYFLPYANRKNLQYNARDATTLSHVLVPLLQDALEAGDLRAQVQSLQAGMLANVEKVESVSDEQFCRDFAALAASIKTFSRGVKIPADANLGNIDTVLKALLLRKTQKCYWKTGSRKKSMIEAFIWSVLIVSVFRSPFHMVGNICNSIANEFRALFLNEHHDGWPVPSELAERWRYTTAQQLVDVVGREAIAQGITQNEIKDMRNSMLDLRRDACKVVESVFGSLSPNTDFSTMTGIVNKAVQLAQQMSLQRSRIQVFWPYIGEKFAVGDTPHLKSIPESEDIEEGYVAFIVNPGLTKWGDSHGKNLDKRQDLTPSTVFIEA
ncbi:hypothetical protein K458DRAFT_249113, partial [Lentithecium fluviatile CBS 122367]